ncbi:MAG TPA: septum formation initiator family protein, partial [bacterium]|nr:septum formation initiator family protein [bacterium]HQA84056.1 septum formation initiator family protein [bacterium]
STRAWGACSSGSIPDSPTMNKLPSKNRHKRYQSILITIAGLLALIFILTGLVKNIRQVFGVKSEITQLEAEIKRLDKKNQEVADLVDYLDSKEFLEEEARLKFDLRQPNEQIIVIKQSDSSTDAADHSANSVFDLPAPQKEKVAISRNPSLWFKYFFDHKVQ